MNRIEELELKLSNVKRDFDRAIAEAHGARHRLRELLSTASGLYAMSEPYAHSDGALENARMQVRVELDRSRELLFPNG